MKRGEHGEIAGPVFKDVIEVPDLEMVAHADEQRALRDPAARAHPRCDRDAALAVQSSRRDESEGAALGRLAGLRVVVGLAGALAPVPFGDASAVVHDHALRFVVQADEQMIVGRARLDGDAERVVKLQISTHADTGQSTADEEIVHKFPIHRFARRHAEAWSSRRILYPMILRLGSPSLSSLLSYSR